MDNSFYKKAYWKFMWIIKISIYLEFYLLTSLGLILLFEKLKINIWFIPYSNIRISYTIAHSNRKCADYNFKYKFKDHTNLTWTEVNIPFLIINQKVKNKLS